MRYDEFLVGVIALALAVLATGFATGPWATPYQLTSIANVQSRYGKHAARCIWLLIAILSGTSGAAILTGLRPSFASPPSQLDLPR